ncbi:MAG: hypothetical protein KAR06_04175 [Deltaproteobacteria bacterium]|nr:hypothetical protein [Deltaproteobacteria bacterium]
MKHTMAGRAQPCHLKRLTIVFVMCLYLSFTVAIRTLFRFLQFTTCKRLSYFAVRRLIAGMPKRLPSFSRILDGVSDPTRELPPLPVIRPDFLDVTFSVVGDTLLRTLFAKIKMSISHVVMLVKLT